MVQSKAIKTVFLLLVLILRANLHLYTEITASIGSIAVSNDELDGKAGYRFSIRDVSISGAKGKRIHFGFNIYQGKWLDNGWTAQEAIIVPYAETSWADAGWFFYDFAYLNSAGNKNRTFEGHFFIVDTAAATEIASKSIEFTTKTMFDYFAEGYRRLENHPDAAGFYIDNKVYGAWAKLEMHNEGYGVTISYIDFKADGTGLMENLPWYLMKDGTLRSDESKMVQYPFYWGIITDFTDQEEPVTLIKMVFEDSSYLHYYYGCFEDGTLGVILFDDQTGRAAGETNVFIPYKRFAADWNENADQLADALVELYKADVEYQQVQSINLSMALMGEHYAFTNLLNAMAW